MLDKCNLCPFNCNVNRKEGFLGKCRAGKNVRYAISSLHYNEEPCISGKSGSGTVFFSNCNLKCVFCQNYEISSEEYGKEISDEELADIFIELQNKKANNVNLVTPTPYVYQIINAIKIAKEKGLNIPILYIRVLLKLHKLLLDPEYHSESLDLPHHFQKNKLRYGKY